LRAVGWQRGEQDIPAKTFQESLTLVRTQAVLPNFNFHDYRVGGHRDDGVLIGNVYGHLANEHRKAMAGRVNFGPTLINLGR
jgi:hypothetical protein